MTNRLAEEWYRQYLAWSYGRRGIIVIFDRHFFADYHAYDIEGGPGLPLSRRIHGFVLEKAYPKPDRRLPRRARTGPPRPEGEGSLELLERRRSDYLGLAEVAADFAVVDATLPVGQVTDRVVALIRERACAGEGHA